MVHPIKEFFRIYGFGMAIILAAIGALVYSGALSPESHMKEGCKINSNLECTDYKVYENTAELTIKNYGDIISIQSISIGDCSTNHGEALKLEKGGVLKESFADCNFGMKGEKIREEIKIFYVGSIESIKGTLTTTIR